MDRAVEKIEGDESHDMMTFTTQGEREFQEWARVFPDDLPSTHELRHRWVDNDRGQRVLQVRVFPRGAAGLRPHDEANGPLVVDAPGGKVDPAALEARRKELAERKKEDLQTLGAELGLDLADSLTKAQMVALILEAEAEPAKPE